MRDRRPKRQTPKQMQDACDRFNAAYPIGSEITVYTGLVGESPKLVKVRYPALILGGHTPVVYVAGDRHGCVALTHVAKAPPHDR